MSSALRFLQVMTACAASRAKWQNTLVSRLALCSDKIESRNYVLALRWLKNTNYLALCCVLSVPEDKYPPRFLSGVAHWHSLEKNKTNEDSTCLSWTTTYSKEEDHVALFTPRARTFGKYSISISAFLPRVVWRNVFPHVNLPQIMYLCFTSHQFTFCTHIM